MFYGRLLYGGGITNLDQIEKLFKNRNRKSRHQYLCRGESLFVREAHGFLATKAL